MWIGGQMWNRGLMDEASGAGEVFPTHRIGSLIDHLIGSFLALSFLGAGLGCAPIPPP